jgi:tRNA(Ile)-lysidine synthase
MPLSTSLLLRFFSSYQKLAKFYVAYSGGLDSTVLLHVMHHAKLPVHAVHVNHQLQQNSDAWQQHCIEVCQAWQIPLTVKRANIKKIPQKSIEDSARQARYALLEEMLDSDSAILTAHHQDDLAETILLQLLRGAGSSGLAAIPESKKLTVGFHLRPLLPFTRAEIKEYAALHNLQWVEDPSNELCEFDRNYLRKEIMPKLLERWPAAQRTLARSASLQAEARICLQDLAEIDIQTTRTDQPQVLIVSALQQLGRERLNNVLRYWIKSFSMRMPSRKILQQIVADIVLKEGIDSSPVQTWKEGEIRRFRNQLYLMSPLKPHDSAQEFCWKVDQPLFIQSLERTLHPKLLKDNHLNLPDEVTELIVRFRKGGEQLKPFGSKHHRSLKNLLLEAGVPPWERSRIPLLYLNDKLISVLGYWSTTIDCETTK